jgi:ectoine hydroxylase-related dioxygenase (phytanoyl-CoA dioxygenase family)
MRPLFERLLGKDYILGSLGAVISLPGATLQQLHSDGGDLFDDNMKSSITIPAYAITMGIPLIEMNTTTGTTRMFQKSHHALSSSVDRQKGIDPIIKTGSCVLFDYRLQHQGTPNVSDSIRPLLYNIYYRPWFRDSFNYSKQAHLLVSEEEATKIPAELHGLFKWRVIQQKNGSS